ncbi:multidrug effflux MFS transporter [Tatumella terrea]|uniref:Bcr/CflA family efflux transporter n=1 Tax=Tatumella terrea TaxID=419007 RepID=A0ABW1W1Q5_9GAMM
MSDMKSQPRHAALPVTGMPFVLILSALMAFTSLSTDIYLPALPAMQKDLQGNTELTITGFLLGFCIAQLVWGPISDSLGRRKPLMIGMVLFIVGSIGCSLSHNITQIVFWRVFQALGACTGPMLARAMIRDLFTRTRAAQMLSVLMMIMSIAPIAGPLMGGQIIRFASWQAIFWLLAGLGTLMLISLYWLPETLPPEKRVKSSPVRAVTNYYSLLRNTVFMRFTLCLAFYYLGVYAFVAGSPFVYISYFGVDPQYFGWLFAVNIVGVVIMSQANRHLVRHFPLEKLLKVAAIVAAIAATVLALVSAGHPAGMVLIVITILFFFSMNGIIAAGSTAAALDNAGEITGSASALIGSLQYGSGIFASLLLAMFSDGTPWTMAWIIWVFSLASAIMALTTRVQPQRDDD